MNRQNSVALTATNLSECRDIVLYQPQNENITSESGNQNCTSPTEGGIAAQISVSTNELSDEGRLDLVTTEDDDVPSSSGFVYDDAIIEELLSDRFGTKRLETDLKKSELLGTSTNVGGQVWTVCDDIPESVIDEEDFIETGIRSNDVELDCLPKRLRSRSEIIIGSRSSPRRTPKGKLKRDESKAINKYFMLLFPVNWKQSLKRLNAAIKEDEANLRKKCSKVVSEREYWIFVGLLILCAVQKSGGIDGLYNTKETEGLVQRINASEYMSYTRLKFIKTVWMRQFELSVSTQEKETNKWWRVGYLVNGFNANRKQTVASSRVKTLDESMSAYRPQTRKDGNLPNISYIMRKPEPLGTELKTVASIGSNGPLIYAEIQEGKLGMRNKSFFSTYGATSSCVLRLVQGTKDNGQKPDPVVRNLFYGDSWFASLKTAVAVTEEFDSEFLGPVKTSHKHFPKSYLEKTMEEWPPGSHLLLETTVRGKTYYALGYKYIMKKTICFVATEKAGHTGDGDPYEARWLDDNGRMSSRNIKRPHILSEYFNNSNQIDMHNHARQSQLAIEKNVVTHDGYFRLWCTYLGITVTDAWKLYRHDLGDNCGNKNISINSFANILCKTHLLNDYSQNYESNPNPPLPCLPAPDLRQPLAFPLHITTGSQDTALSSLGSGSGQGLLQIGNGKYIPSSFQAPHKEALCIPTTTYINAGKGSFSKRRRKRNRCPICNANTTCQCTICMQWYCSASTSRACFEVHKSQQIDIERNAYWQSLQDT